MKRALVMQTETLWFKDDGDLNKTLCVADSVMEKNEICFKAHETFFYLQFFCYNQS